MAISTGRIIAIFDRDCGRNMSPSHLRFLASIKGHTESPRLDGGSATQIVGNESQLTGWLTGQQGGGGALRVATIHDHHDIPVVPH